MKLKYKIENRASSILNYSLIIGIAFCIGMLPACKKLVDVNPPSTSLSGSSVFNSDITATAVLTGVYAQMSNNVNNAGHVSSLSLFAGLSADEFTLWNGLSNPQAFAYYQNALAAKTASDNYGAEYWSTIYPLIFDCNDAIAGLTAATNLTPGVKQQLLGEAKFMRAYFYFYLVNLYGDVPLVLTNDYKVNQSLPRSPKAQVYQQIIADLHNAQTLLSINFLDPTLQNTSTERLRPSHWAAIAMLARAYLYTGKWAQADSASSVLISNTGIFGLSSLNNTFLRAGLGNNEVIWQLQPVSAGAITNTADADVFIMSSSGPGQLDNFGAYMSNNLLNSFEPGDQRKTNWVDSVNVAGTTYYYPFKYKVGINNPNYPPNPPVTEYEMMLRLGEQYLIRAEAKANEGDLAGAATDLNSIRARAGLPATISSSTTSLLSAIYHERQVELFSELGHRWFDLKRTGNIDGVMTAVTPQKTGSTGNWHSYQQLYPIYVPDIQLDPKLSQNSGY